MASTTTTTTAGTADIDALLTTYLSLLDTYTTLRSKLTALQSSVGSMSLLSSLTFPQPTNEQTANKKKQTSLSLARASFTHPNSLYTTPSANPKLRASVRLRVSPPEDRDDTDDEGGEVFTLLPLSPITPSAAKKETETNDTEDDAPDTAAEAEEGDTDPSPSPSPSTSHTNPKTTPPLPPGFGVLPPPSLREAQGSAIEAVHIITQLAGVEVQMRGLEVEVRRARKRARKSEKAEKAEKRGGYSIA